MKNRTIQYAEHADGYVISRVGNELAWPILDYIGMTPENGFAMKYDLERVPVLGIGREWSLLRWTKKIPVAIKNVHRTFWTFKPLKIPR